MTEEKRESKANVNDDDLMKRKNLLVLMDVDTEKVFPVFYILRSHSFLYIYISTREYVRV